MVGMKQRTGTCDERAFWDAVAEIGWGTKTMDYRRVEERLLQSWDGPFTHGFKTKLTEKWTELIDVVEEFEKREGVTCGLVEESFWDLMHHIVGLGKKEYEATLKNPMRAIRRGRDYDYVRSFAYCLPYVPPEQRSLEGARFKARLLLPGASAGEIEARAVNLLKERVS